MNTSTMVTSTINSIGDNTATEPSYDYNYQGTGVRNEVLNAEEVDEVIQINTDSKRPQLNEVGC